MGNFCLLKNIVLEYIKKNYLNRDICRGLLKKKNDIYISVLGLLIWK